MLKRTERFDFNSAQFLFESIGMLVFYYIRAGSPDKAALEQVILNFFQVALKNKSDLLNFCLQVIAIFLQLEQVSNNQYRVIYDSLLMEENWREENQSVMSSFIQFIIAFLSRFRERLVSDRPAIELILSKIIQIDHIELFFRFLEAIMQNTSLEEFNSCGYMNILVRGSEALAQSIQGRKATLLFFSRLLVHYGNQMQVLHMVFLSPLRLTSAVRTSTTSCWQPAETSSSQSLCVAIASSFSWRSAGPLRSSTIILTQLFREYIA